MSPLRILTCALLALALSSCLVGCSERDPGDLEIATAPDNPVVFTDAYDDDVYFQPFFETFYTAAEYDSVYAYAGYAFDGARSLKLSIPPVGSALGPYTGGVLTSVGARDLTGYNALTFYARAGENITLNTVGFGNDNTGTSRYGAERSSVPLTGDWTYVVVPIPNPARLIAERGLFTFAEGTEEQYPDGYAVWLDEIRFAQVEGIELYLARMTSATVESFVGATVDISGTSSVYLIDEMFVPVSHSPHYFDFTSSDPAVARVTDGVVRLIGEGSAQITGELDGVAVSGTVSLTGYLPPQGPAPAPTWPASDVISLFSGSYEDVAVDTWRANWGGVTTQTQEYTVGGDPVRLYSQLNWVGIEFLTEMVDAADMTHFHLDVYAPRGTNFRVKLVAFPPDLAGSVETAELILNSESDPAFITEQWCGLEIPLTAFALPVNWDWSYLGQLVLATTDAKLVLVDNIYWHK